MRIFVLNKNQTFDRSLTEGSVHSPTQYNERERISAFLCSFVTCLVNKGMDIILQSLSTLSTLDTMLSPPSHTELLFSLLEN